MLKYIGMEASPTVNLLTPLEGDALKEQTISIFVLHYYCEAVKGERN